MNRFTLFLLSLLISVSTLFAISRDSTEAHRLAQTFFNKTTKSLGAQKAPALTSAVRLVFSKTKKNESSSNYYYVFNLAENKGFVIVSGEEATNDILAYSDENSFDPQNIPDNMKYWLSIYEKEIDNLNVVGRKAPKDEAPKISKIKSVSENVSAIVSPLLGGIKWNQDAPYNGLCPVINSSTNERAATGCVATGMAQIMKYHQWPITGTGSNSYTTHSYSIPLSVDFSNTTFDWANMTDTYNANSTISGNNAVATLMYNCGVAVNMDYAESSGAYSRDAAEVLINNFGYDSNIQYVDRGYYTREEWKTMIKEELSAARPVLYSGNSGSSGHFFVCDGYDDNDFFHFNWGWGGMSNGYFRISVLDPADQGIGGSTGGYNNSQSIITGIQKPTPLSIPKYLIYSGDSLTYPADSLSRNATFTIKVNEIYNYGINSFNGNIGLALFDSNNIYISNLSQYPLSNMNSYSGWNQFDFTGIKINEEITNGNYKVFCVYKSNTENDWQIVRTDVGTPNYINLVVNSNFIYFDTPTDAGPVLQLNSITTIGNLYSNKIGRTNISITNNGKEYNSLISVQLQSTTDSNIVQTVSSKSINIAAGETRELNFNDSIKLPVGIYYLSILYTPKNTPYNSDLVQLGNSIIVSIIDTPLGNPMLSLVSKIAFPDANGVDKNNAILTAQITNTGSLYDKKMIAFIFSKLGGNSLTYLGHQDVIIDQDETKSVTFKGMIDLPLNEYVVAIYYKNSGDEWTGFEPSNFSELNFTLINDVTGLLSIETMKNLIIYPNPATDQITIPSNNSIHTYRIFNLVGEELQSENSITTNQHIINISSLHPGSYLIRIETEVGVSNQKFIKQ